MQVLAFFSEECASVSWRDLVNSDQPSDMLVPGSGSMEQFITAVEQAAAQHHSSEVFVTAVLQGSQVMCRHAMLPANLRAARLAQAVPYALEEQISGDIDACHFTVANKMADGGWPVAIVAKSVMQTLLAHLHSAKVKCLLTVCVPDFLAIETVEDGWHIVLHDDSAICRLSRTQGFTIETSMLVTLLTLQAKQLKTLPQKIVVSGENAEEVVASCQQSWTLAGEWVLDDAPPKLILDRFADNLLRSAPLLNCASGEFSPKLKADKFTKSVRRVGVLAGLCVLVVLLGQLTTTLYFHNQAASVDADIAKAYKQAYPQATNVVSPRARIEKEIKELGASGPKDQFIALLQDVSAPLTQEVVIRSLVFSKDALQIHLQLKSFSDLEKLTEQWKKSGLNVTREQASSESEGVVAVMRFTG